LYGSEFVFYKKGLFLKEGGNFVFLPQNFKSIYESNQHQRKKNQKISVQGEEKREEKQSRKKEGKSDIKKVFFLSPDMKNSEEE